MRAFRDLQYRSTRAGLLVLVAGLALGACYGPQPVQRVEAAPATITLPPTQVYFYPNAGQSAAQQDRDRYECHLWAVRQSGFDPSLPLPPPAPRVEVIAGPPPGHDTAVGAVTGAMIGAIVGHPHDTAEGAVVGAVAGATLGALSDRSRQVQSENLQGYQDPLDAQRMARLERSAQDYRRAMSACLEGRGYTVH